MVTAGEDDPMNPCNWPLLLRCKNIAILSLLIFSQAWVGAAESMANSQISQEFGVSKTVENLSTAMYLFGIGSGSSDRGPCIGDVCGRNPTYLISTGFCLCFVPRLRLDSSIRRPGGLPVLCWTLLERDPVDQRR